jgi:patatin-related protein
MDKDHVPGNAERSMAPDRETQARAGEAELRLALVCYGGVSLAVYMHGVTKELHKLVVAARRFDELADVDASVAFPDGEPGSDTEHVYFQVLRELATHGRRLSVTIDIIAGTSAGGINGICLGKVIARNGSQDKLKQLWIDEGDLKKLLRAPAIGGWRLQAVLAALPVIARPRLAGSPLRGERMSQLLFEAISDMDRQRGQLRSLIKPGATLDLFVTTTDLHGFEVLVPTGVGGASQRDRNYAQVMEFQSGPEGSAFDAGSAGALAFAARATSCFPGAFPPVSLASFEAELAGGSLFGWRRKAAAPRGDAAARIVRSFRNSYAENRAWAENAWFVDGGLLDNAPFDLVVQAISDKPAQSEVIRRIVYIQPDPGEPLEKQSTDAHADARAPAPGWLPALWQGVSRVRASHPVLRELLGIREMNTRIGAIGAIAASQQNQVNAVISHAWERTNPSNATSPWDMHDQKSVQALSEQVHEGVKQQIGLNYAGYCLLKAEVAGRRFADELAKNFAYPPTSNRTSFLRSAIAAWASNRSDWKNLDTTALMQFFGPIDIPYRERRLLFILAGVNDLYSQADLDPPSGLDRACLNALKTKAWDLLEKLRRAPQTAAKGARKYAGFLDHQTLNDATLLSDPRTFAAKRADDFQRLFEGYASSLKRVPSIGSQPLWEAYVQTTQTWRDTYGERQALLSRYLGFPLWDALIFPTVTLSRLPQFTPIGVSQFSPLAARAIPAPPAGPGNPGRKLRGVSMQHFGAFTDAAWRENDYLWGRLDAAELILRMLRQDSSSPGQQITPATAEEAIELAGREHLQAALSAIIDAEQGLQRIPEITAYLRTRIKNIIQ